MVGRRHIHHFVPGIMLAFVAGGVAIVTRNETVERWMALPFGAGMGLTLDESALLLELDDVYWSEEGILSVQITLAVTALLAATALAARVLLRGEQEVLPAPAPVRARPVGWRRWKAAGATRRTRPPSRRTRAPCSRRRGRRRCGRRPKNAEPAAADRRAPQAPQAAQASAARRRRPRRPAAPDTGARCRPAAGSSPPACAGPARGAGQLGQPGRCGSCWTD